MEITAILGVLGTILSALGSVAGVVFGLGAAGAVRFVHEGERGVRLRFGKVVRKNGHAKVIHPGWCWLWPGIEKLARTHVRQRVLNCGNQQITLKDETVFTVDAILVYQVGDTPGDLYSALFEVENLDDAVRMYCIGVLREVVQSLDFRGLIGRDPQEMATELNSKVADQLRSWGLLAISFKLGDMSPYGETLSLIQTQTGVRFKVQSLIEAAKSLGMEANGVPNQLAAALVGVPVAVSIANTRGATPNEPFVVRQASSYEDAEG